jgi:hypothetical protein
MSENGVLGLPVERQLFNISNIRNQTLREGVRVASAEFAACHPNHGIDWILIANQLTLMKKGQRRL